MDILTSLAEARRAGVRVASVVGRLEVRGPRRLFPLVERLLADAPAVLAALDHEAWEAWGRHIADTAANVTGASPGEKRGWHREVVAALRWIEAGQPADEQW